MPTFTGTNAAEIITPSQVSATVTRDPAGGYPSDVFDVINAGGGNDFVSGGAGNDSVILGEGDDLYIWNLGDQNDTVEGGNGADTVQATGTQGGDTFEVYSQGGYAKIAAAGGTLSAQNTEHIKVFAFGGADRIDVASMSGTTIQRIDIDLGGTVSGPPDDAQDDVFVSGSNGNDIIALTRDGDSLRIAGLAAEVSVRGSDVADKLSLSGGIGDDRIDASAAPSDLMQIQIHGGDGDDDVTGSAVADWLWGDADDDALYAGAGDDHVFGGSGNDHIEGGEGSDSLDGSAGDDLILGGGGDDALFGSEGNDVIEGGAGRDALVGNLGNDVLKGGGGADQFIFTEIDLGTSGVDKIRDFKPGKDSIAFDLLVEIGTEVDKGEFVIGKKAKDADDHLIYNKKTGMLSFDTDGKGGEDAFAFAKLKKHLDMSHKDFDVLMS